MIIYDDSDGHYIQPGGESQCAALQILNEWTGQTQYQQNTHKVSQVKVFIELNQRFQSVELLYVIIIYVLMWYVAVILTSLSCKVTPNYSCQTCSGVKKFNISH